MTYDELSRELLWMESLERLGFPFKKRKTDKEPQPYGMIEDFQSGDDWKHTHQYRLVPTEEIKGVCGELTIQKNKKEPLYCVRGTVYKNSRNFYGNSERETIIKLWIAQQLSRYISLLYIDQIENEQIKEWIDQSYTRTKELELKNFHLKCILAAREAIKKNEQIKPEWLLEQTKEVNL